MQNTKAQRNFFELDLGADKISIVSMGASGKVSFVYSGSSKNSAIESACILNLSQPHKILIKQNGKDIEFYIDDSLQGSIKDASFTKIIAAKAAKDFRHIRTLVSRPKTT